MFSPLEYFTTILIYDWPVIIDLADWGFTSVIILDFSIFNTIIPMLLLFCWIFYILLLFFKNFFLLPTTFQYLLEFNIIFIFNIIKEQTGKKGFIFFPFLFTCFTFIFFCNLVSLVPFGISLTSHIIMIMWLSMTIIIAIFILGWFVLGINFVWVFIPSCPLVLLPFLIAIELFSYAIRMISLSVRLSANVLGGHTLVSIISISLTSLAKMKFWFVFIGSIFLILILILELGVSFLQAYVFLVLVCIYLRDSLNIVSH